MGLNHARVLSDMEEVVLAAVSDPDPAALTQVARRSAARPYADHRAMLGAEQLDAAVIAAPTSSHASVAIDALSAGLDVLVEKPVASSVEEGTALLNHALRHKRLLWVGHVERFNPAVIALKQRLDAGDLGRVIQLHARRLGPFPPRVADVGVVLDLSTHDIDVMRFLTGQQIVRLYAQTQRRIHTAHEDAVSGVLTFADGTTGVLETNWLTPTKVRELTVTGEKGMFVVNYVSQELTFYENAYRSSDGATSGVMEGNVIKLRVEAREPLRVELETFVRSVLQQDPRETNAGDALAALEIASHILSSAASSQVVSLLPSALPWPSPDRLLTPEP